MNNEINYVSPFKKFVITVGNLPTAYMESMSYYEAITFLVNYLSNNVIPALNNNGLVVEELQAKFTELKNYVDHYFDNLDLQEEVNNKLDAMVEDGTLDKIINQEIFGELNDKVTENTNDISTINNDITIINNNINSINTVIDELDGNVTTTIEKLRKNNYNDYKILTKNTTNSFFDKIQIYESDDKQNYKYYINEEDLKNSGGSTIYVDKNFVGTSDGSESAPYKTIYTGIEHCVDGDTLIIKKAIYRREQIPGKTQIIPNINIICEEGTLLTASSELTWSQNGTYSNVYQATRSNSTSVIDVRDKTLPVGLEKKNSLAEVSQLIGSYYTDNVIVYVNLGEEVTNDKVVVNLAIGDNQQLNFTPKNSQNLKVYLENAICLNGDNPLVKASNTSSYTCEFNAKNCKFLFNVGNTTNGIDLLGSKSVLINCQASYNKKDGFNYHMNNYVACKGIEINCNGSYNGRNNSDHLNNGSTMHDGGEIIRIDGNYFRNNGANVADVNTGTISLNINCNAFDSVAETTDAYTSDFCTQQSGAVMYLYNCIAKGNSYKNIYAVTDSTIYASNCKYDTTQGNVIIS